MVLNPCFQNIFLLKRPSETPQRQLGFEDAFNLSFGYSTEEFYQEFDTFLELPIEEQLEIIPDI